MTSASYEEFCATPSQLAFDPCEESVAKPNEIPGYTLRKRPAVRRKYEDEDTDDEEMEESGGGLLSGKTFSV